MIKDVENLILSHNNLSGKSLVKGDIDEYVLKLSKYATIIPYYVSSNLKGFIAYYCNDLLKNTAYLTLIVIEEGSRGQGIGKLLLESSISDLINRGFKTYKLEVLKHNAKALELYCQYGFIIEEDRDDIWLMKLNLKNDFNNAK